MIMRLSTMWSVDATIDADGRSPVADQIVRRWRHDGGSTRFFRSSANFIYTFTRDGERHFVRFAADSERDRAAVEAETAVVDWLDRAAWPVPRPRCSLDGDLVETVETELGTFHAVVFAGVGGRQLEVEDLDSTGFERWGRALGELHRVLSEWSPPASAVESSWRSDRAPGDVGAANAEVLREREAIDAAFEGLPVGPGRVGAIHGDFELDNLVWTDDAVTALDFEGCRLDWFVADIALATRDLFDNGADVDHPDLGAFLHGYRDVMPIDDALLECLPIFVRRVRLLEHDAIARALDLPAGDYPAWLVSLRDQLAARRDAYVASLPAGKC